MSRPAGPVPTTHHQAVAPARPARRGAGRRVAARRAGVVAGALLASATAASAASAATPSWAAIQTPLVPYAVPDADAGSTAATATGNGHVAWVTLAASQPGSPEVAASVWTLRAGAAVKVAEVPMLTQGLGAVELGTDVHGAPVLVVGVRGLGDRPPQLHLVRLDTGAVRPIAPVRRGLTVGGAAIDAGRVYYTLNTPGKTGPRNTSSLWRATLTGTSIGRGTKLRTSRRGERWNAVHADLGRVAVETSGAPDAEHDAAFLRENVAFGTPGGRWARTPDAYATEGGSVPVFVLGFTKDRKSLVVERGPGTEGSPAELLRAPIDGGRRSSVRVGGGVDLRASSLDPSTGRLLAFGPDAAGTPSIGWTGVAVR